MELVLASLNAGKIAEFNQVLSPLSWHLQSLSQYTNEAVDETGLTFIENAILKARFAAKVSGLPALADDSGIEVDYLKGAPGIYSARYSGQGDAANNLLLLQALEGVAYEQRSARYRCVLAFLRHELDPSPIIAEGSWNGFIHDREQGKNGFGYDSIFWLPEHQMTAAELEPKQKNRSSHRALAIQALTARLALEMNKLNFEVS